VEDSHPSHFDFDEIDERLAAEKPSHPDSKAFQKYQEHEERISSPAEMFVRLLDMILPESISVAALPTIGIRLLCVAWIIQHGHKDIHGRPQSEIARKIGVTRALMSFYVRAIEKILGTRIHSRAQKSTRTPLIYKQSALEGWKTRDARERQARSLVRQRLKGAPDELTDALANQPREMVRRIIADWGASIEEELKNAPRSFACKARQQWPRPEANTTSGEIEAIGGA